MSRSTYYYEISKVNAVEERNAELTHEIEAVFEENHGRYGVRRVYHALRNLGFSVNHKRVQRIMHEIMLFGKKPKEKYHSYTGCVGPTADNIIDRNFKASAPNQKWTTDVSQLNFSWGKCYISVLLDMYSNEIVAYDLSMSPNIGQIRRMLNSAFEKHPDTKGLIVHSDQGWQYQHIYFRNELKNHGIIQSMSRKGNCYDNSIMESFFGRMKNEMYYGHEKDFACFTEFSAAVDKYIYYYNNVRIQQKTNWMPPVPFSKAS